MEPPKSKYTRQDLKTNHGAQRSKSQDYHVGISASKLVEVSESRPTSQVGHRVQHYSRQDQQSSPTSPVGHRVQHYSRQDQQSSPASQVGHQIQHYSRHRPGHQFALYIRFPRHGKQPTSTRQVDVPRLTGSFRAFINVRSDDSGRRFEFRRAVLASSRHVGSKASTRARTRARTKQRQEQEQEQEQGRRAIGMNEKIASNVTVRFRTQGRLPGYRTRRLSLVTA